MVTTYLPHLRIFRRVQKSENVLFVSMLIRKSSANLHFFLHMCKFFCTFAAYFVIQTQNETPNIAHILSIGDHGRSGGYTCQRG